MHARVSYLRVQYFTIELSRNKISLILDPIAKRTAPYTVGGEMEKKRIGFKGPT